MIPIKLDLRWGSIELRDAFCWNTRSSGHWQTPLDFARTTCRDLVLPDAFAEHMAAEIQSQIDLKSQFTQTPAPSAEQMARDRGLGLLNIKLEINVGGLLVKDSFGWNPYRTLPNFTDGDEPELFGSALATYLGLDASGATLIAVEIREQLWRHFQAIATNQTSPIPRLNEISAADGAISAHVPSVQQVLAFVPQ